MRVDHGIRAIAFVGAAMALLSTPAIAQDGPVSFVLSTTMQRTCDAALTITPTDARGSPTAAPMVTASTRGFFARPDPQGLQLTQWAREPAGEARLIATMSPQGRILAARLEGTLVAAMQAQSAVPIDTQQIASAAARDIPERLVAGRRFAPGDALYDPAMAQAITDQLMAGLGVPFPVDSTVNVVFLGSQTAAMGRNVFAFGGGIVMTGEGQMPAGWMEVDADFTFTVLFDQSTGLMLSSLIDGDFDIDVNGQRALTMTMTDEVNCRIGPQERR